jgi:hypothetical protein
VSPAWKPSYGLWDAPPREWRKLLPEHAHALIATREITCDDCGDVIPIGGPVRVFCDQDGIPHHHFCGRCVVAYAERKTLERLMGDIVAMCPHPRSRGRATQQLLARGYRLADVRLAFDELLEDGRLERDRRGMVSARQAVETLFDEVQS